LRFWHWLAPSLPHVPQRVTRISSCLPNSARILRLPLLLLQAPPQPLLLLLPPSSQSAQLQLLREVAMVIVWTLSAVAFVAVVAASVAGRRSVDAAPQG
jgi:hypothetical protein